MLLFFTTLRALSAILAGLACFYSEGFHSFFFGILAFLCIVNIKFV